jgi:hypothetical protein
MDAISGVNDAGIVMGESIVILPLITTEKGTRIMPHSHSIPSPHLFISICLFEGLFSDSGTESC